jgi:hypothetical protein
MTNDALIEKMIVAYQRPGVGLRKMLGVLLAELRPEKPEPVPDFDPIADSLRRAAPQLCPPPPSPRDAAVERLIAVLGMYRDDLVEEHFGEIVEAFDAVPR